MQYFQQTNNTVIIPVMVVINDDNIDQDGRGSRVQLKF